MKFAASETLHPEWNRYVESCEGTVYHSREWADCSKRENSTPLYLTWRDSDGEPGAIAVAQLNRSSLPLIGKWNSTLSLGSYPAMAPAFRARAAEVFGTLKTFSASAGCRLIDVESHMAPELDLDTGSLGATSRERIEFRLPLADLPDDFLRSFSEHHRRKIRKADKRGLAVRDSQDAVDASLLRELQKTSRDRRASRGEHQALGADAPIVELMRRMLSAGIGRLFVVIDAGEDVSAALLSEYRGRAYYVFGGSNDAGFRADAPALLFWKAIGYYRERGFSEFNLGGVAATAADPKAEGHGLFRFKAGFGTQQLLLRDCRFDVRPAMTRLLRVLGRS